MMLYCYKKYLQKVFFFFSFHEVTAKKLLFKFLKFIRISYISKENKSIKALYSQITLNLEKKIQINIIP